MENIQEDEFMYAYLRSGKLFVTPNVELAYKRRDPNTDIYSTETHDND